MKGKKHKVRTFIGLDLLFYAVIPYVFWKFGTEYLDDYIALLVSTIPGFAYTIYRFVKDRQFNMIGLFVIGSLLLGTVVNLLSGSAERMLWNGVYLGLFYVVLHFIALVIKRPFALYFAVDFVYLQGYERESSKRLFYQKGIFKWYQMIQSLFIIRGLCLAGMNIYVLKKTGVDGYDQMIIYRQIIGWIFSALIMGLYFYTQVPIQRFVKALEIESNQKGETISDIEETAKL